MFEERLEGLVDTIDGARAACLVARDGITVSTVTREPDLDLEALAAELLTRTHLISEDHRQLALGELRQIAVTTDRYSILVGAVTDEYYLLLVVAAGGGFGRARFELRRAGLRFAEDLV